MYKFAWPNFVLNFSQIPVSNLSLKSFAFGIYIAMTGKKSFPLLLTPIIVVDALTYCIRNIQQNLYINMTVNPLASPWGYVPYVLS